MEWCFPWRAGGPSPNPSPVRAIVSHREKVTTEAENRAVQPQDKVHRGQPPPEAEHSPADTVTAD